MNNIKKILGVIWLLLGPITAYYLLKTAVTEINLHPGIDTKIQWGIFGTVFFPIAFGISLFGWFAIKGEYEHLPQSSNEIEED